MNLSMFCPYSFGLKLQVVLSCIEGSPAARAGIHQGDELVEINGTDQEPNLFFLTSRQFLENIIPFS